MVRLISRPVKVVLAPMATTEVAQPINPISIIGFRPDSIDNMSLNQLLQSWHRTKAVTQSTDWNDDHALNKRKETLDEACCIPDLVWVTCGGSENDTHL